MQFKVPQDVQREDTIIGPLTLKQLAILGVGGGITYAIYTSLARTYFMEVWLPPVLITSVITLAFAFLKVHSLPFYEFLMCFIEYHVLPKKRIWIQGTGQPFVSALTQLKPPKKEIIKQKNNINTKSIEELTDIVDKGSEVLAEKQEKKENLQKLIDHQIK